jgi:malate dehydrogenase (oxaloacetate-decarboxylating)
MQPEPTPDRTARDDAALALHEGGKIRVQPSVPIRNRHDLALAYTPGVASVCLAIERDPDLAFTHTVKRNTVAVVTDGTAVLGLGDVGPLAAEPVMSGKAMLFKEFGGVDAFPICLDTTDVDAIIATVRAIAPVFGGINLEDISAPRCFEIEDRLREALDIPVFHDDQHGTAIVVLAGLLNALRLTGRRWRDTRVVISGAGAAGVACARMLSAAGAGEIVCFDRAGAVYAGRTGLGSGKRWLAERTNQAAFRGTLREALRGADVFLGLSGAGLIPGENFQEMAREAIVFALANPEPEVRPEELPRNRVRIVATGSSDYRNQINNVLAFPGVFRGALDAGARRIDEEMKLAAAHAIAASVRPEDLAEDLVVPSPLDRTVATAVAEAVADAARRSGAVRASGAARRVAAAG